MATFLRFTRNAEADIDLGYSYLKTPSMQEAERLEGLCAFSFDLYVEDEETGRERLMTESEIERKIAQYAQNFAYYNNGVAAIIEGEYLGQNPNGEGVIIRPSYLVNEYYS